MRCICTHGVTYLERMGCLCPCAYFSEGIYTLSKGWAVCVLLCTLVCEVCVCVYVLSMCVRVCVCVCYIICTHV